MSDQNEKQQGGESDALDALLFEFRQNVVDESQLSATEHSQLVERIMRAVDEKPSVSHHDKNIAVRKVIVLLAACVCFLLVVVTAQWRASDDAVETPGISGTLRQVFTERHRDQILAVVEHEQVFGLPLAWYVERDNQVRFELATDDGPDKIVSKHQAVYAELRVEKIDGTKSFRQTPTKTVFLMTRGEQSVELYDGQSHQPKLLFWLCPVDENLFAYELAMHENNGLQLSGETVGLIETDKPEQSLTVMQNGLEYHIFLQIHASTT